MLRLCAVVIIVFLLPGCLFSDTQAPVAVDGTCRSQRKGGDQRPNIVLILTDDQQLGMMEAMPKTSRLLGDSGVTFANMFVTLAVCCPSRSTFLRGQYPHNHGVVANFAPQGGWPLFYNSGLEQSTIATWFHDAGYRTALMGKYLNDYTVPGSSPPPTYMPPGWDEWYATLGRDGEFRSDAVFFNYVQNENGRLVQYGSEPTDYHTDVLASEAALFICKSAEQTAPFFLYINTNAPHDPAVAAARHAGAFASLSAPRSPSFNEADVTDKIGFVRNLPLLPPDSIAAIDNWYRREMRSLLAVDDLVEKVITALSSGGLLRNTYVFYTSDNGFHLGEHRLMPAKGTHFEEDIRVPFFVRGPAVPVGKIRNEMVLNNDFAPTLAEIAGIAPPTFVDGRSFFSLLHSEVPQAGWRKAFLVETYGMGSAQSAVRTETTMYRELNDADNATREMYNLTSDPYQLENMYPNRANAVMVATLHRWLAALRTCAAAGCRSAEDSTF